MRNKPQPASKWKRLLSGVAYATLLIAALGVGTGFGIVKRSKVLNEVIKQKLNNTKPDEVFHKDALTVLVLGCDEDLAPGGKVVLRKQARSDMMLVAKIDFAKNQITGVSIPRDTECRLPGDRMRKINAYHAIAKPGEENDLTQQAVEHLLPGVQIDRVVTIDYDAFQDLVNMLGGVQVDVDRKMDYDDNAGNLHIHLKPGPAKLDGYNAMCFVRYRHGDSDFKRQERQKQFLVSFKNAVLKNPAMIGQVADQSMAVLGNALNSTEIASLALFSKQVPPQNIKLGQVPVLEGKGTGLLVDEDKLQDVLAQYRLTDTYGSRVSDNR